MQADRVQAPRAHRRFDAVPVFDGRRHGFVVGVPQRQWLGRQYFEHTFDYALVH
jgi:hypothetical protein